MKKLIMTVWTLHVFQLFKTPTAFLLCTYRLHVQQRQYIKMCVRYVLIAVDILHWWCFVLCCTYTTYIIYTQSTYIGCWYHIILSLQENLIENYYWLLSTCMFSVLKHCHVYVHVCTQLSSKFEIYRVLYTQPSKTSLYTHMLCYNVLNRIYSTSPSPVYVYIIVYKKTKRSCTIYSLPAIFESYATPTPHIPLSLAAATSPAHLVPWLNLNKFRWIRRNSSINSHSHILYYLLNQSSVYRGYGYGSLLLKS